MSTTLTIETLKKDKRLARIQNYNFFFLSYYTMFLRNFKKKHASSLLNKQTLHLLKFDSDSNYKDETYLIVSIKKTCITLICLKFIFHG